YPGTSVYSFCNDYLHLECTGYVDSDAFLVLDETVLEEKEIVVDDINWIGHGTKEYDVYGKLAETVRLNDKNVETQKLDIKYCYEIKAYGLFKINHWNCRRHSKYSSCTTGFKYFENTYMLFV
ncbi:MAG: hypothetical protein J6W58_00870, partial [Lachnospiraceae bacterium]|nr:hypothetical protein [Lachnospiraceae bacterium]